MTHPRSLNVNATIATVIEGTTHMDTIPHRELRNHSSEILARVSRGESIAVTNHGTLAAIISPPTSSPLERARRAGRVREPRGRVDLTTIRRVQLRETSQEILADLRGDR